MVRLMLLLMGTETNFNNIREIIGDGSKKNNGNNGTINDNDPVDGGDDNFGDNELGDDLDDWDQWD